MLKGVDLMIHPGEFVCIYGSSGSGKSTLLNIVGVLDYATEGEYTLDGISIKNLNDKKMAEIRNRKIGFVFQAYHLVQEMNVLENIAVPLGYAGMSKKNRTARAQELLDEWGREFLAEKRRRTDLNRFGLFTTGIWWDKQPSDSYRRFYPIPARAISANPLLKRSEGYIY